MRLVRELRSGAHEMEELAAAGLPFAVRAAASTWPALREWTLERFGEHTGKQKLFLSRSAAVTEGEGNSGGLEWPLPFADWVSRGSSCDPLWHFDPSLLERVPCLSRHFDFEGEMVPDQVRSLATSMHEPFHVLSLSLCDGTRGDGLGWHCHAATIFGLAVGRKDWLLVPPGDFRGPGKSYLETGQGLMCSMEAGDVLFVPSGYYHATKNRERWTAGVARTARWRPGERRAIFEAALLQGHSGAGQKKDEPCEGSILAYELAIEIIADEAAAERQGSKAATDALTLLRAPLELPTGDKTEAASLRQHLVYGNALQQLGRYRESVGAFEVALALEPGNVVTCLRLGIAQLKAGDLDAAHATSMELLALKPHWPPAETLRKTAILLR